MPQNENEKNRALAAMPGRGAQSNIPNRFEELKFVPDPTDEIPPEEFARGPLKTRFFRDHTKSILSTNSSPDVPFEASINPYRGCEHGCSYCYARPTHEYLGLSAGLDFESKIFVKDRAPELLREVLNAKSWKPKTIFFSGVTDCYQPVERRLRLTRRCLEVLAEFKNPVSMITKNELITRDLDLFEQFASWNGAAAFLSITTLDYSLGGVMEPRTSRPQARLKAIELLAKTGMPVGVNVAPVIPGLNDHELPAILEAAAQAGATRAGYIVLRLPLTVEPVFVEWLKAHRPDRAAKVMNHLRAMRGGERLNDPRFGFRMRGQGPFADAISKMFHISCRKLGLNVSRGVTRETGHEEIREELSTAHFKRPQEITPQMQFSLD